MKKQMVLNSVLHEAEYKLMHFLKQNKHQLCCQSIYEKFKKSLPSSKALEEVETLPQCWIIFFQ